MSMRKAFPVQNPDSCLCESMDCDQFSDNIPTTINHYQSCTCKHSNSSIISVISQDHRLGFIEKLGVLLIDRLKAIKQIVGSTDIHWSNVGNAYPFWRQLSFGNSPVQDYYYIRSCVHFKSFIWKEIKEVAIMNNRDFSSGLNGRTSPQSFFCPAEHSGHLLWLYEYKTENFTFFAVKT